MRQFRCFEGVVTLEEDDVSEEIEDSSPIIDFEEVIKEIETDSDEFSWADW